LKDSTFFTRPSSGNRPADGASLLMSGTASMNVQGGVRAAAGAGGNGAVVDIASSAPFLITGPSGPSSDPIAGTIVLKDSVLSAFDASSLLIGGVRFVSQGVTTIHPLSTSVTIDSGAVLNGQEFLMAAAPRTYTVTSPDTPENFASMFSVTAADLLAANPSYSAGDQVPSGAVLKIPGAAVSMNAGSSVSASGSLPARPILVSGDGALLAVSASAGASLVRSGFTPNLSDLQAAVPLASLSIDRGASLSGGSVILDSSSVAVVDSTLKLSSGTTALSAGAVSVGGADPGSLSLSGDLLTTLNASKNLSLSSYSALVLHDGAVLGSSSIGSLLLHAAVLAGDGDGGSATLLAPSGTLLLDNALSSPTPSGYVPGSASGSLAITASRLSLGAGAIKLDGFGSAAGVFSSGISVSGSGALSAAGNLILSTPVLTASGGADYAVSSLGALSLASVASASALPGIPRSGTRSRPVTKPGRSEARVRPTVMGVWDRSARVQAPW